MNESVEVEIRKLLPAFDGSTTQGRITRGCLHDGACKIVQLIHGPEAAAKYASAFCHDPLAGLNAFPEIASQVLAIMAAYSIHLRKVPRIMVSDIRKWLRLETC